MQTLDRASALDRTYDLLTGYAFSGTDEAGLQQAICDVLATRGVRYRREHALCARDRIDFYVPAGRVGIECKTGGSAASAIRQLMRYAESPAISSLILVTVCRKHAGVPPSLNAKPVRTVFMRAF